MLDQMSIRTPVGQYGTTYVVAHAETIDLCMFELV